MLSMCDAGVNYWSVNTQAYVSDGYKVGENLNNERLMFILD